jgi:hypothetical protein
LKTFLVLAAWLACAFVAFGQTPRPGPTAGTGDTRQLVVLPEPMRTHTIANMRDHLLALQQIHEKLSTGRFVEASDIAERRLGMSSLETHGAAHIAARLPPPMQDIGTRMHRAASRFAVETQAAAATNDVRPLLSALSAVMQQCVACHAAYRYQ